MLRFADCRRLALLFDVQLRQAVLLVLDPRAKGGIVGDMLLHHRLAARGERFHLLLALDGFFELGVHERFLLGGTPNLDAIVAVIARQLAHAVTRLDVGLLQLVQLGGRVFNLEIGYLARIRRLNLLQLG